MKKAIKSLNKLGIIALTCIVVGCTLENETGQESPIKYSDEIENIITPSLTKEKLVDEVGKPYELVEVMDMLDILESEQLKLYSMSAYDIATRSSNFYELTETAQELLIQFTQQTIDNQLISISESMKLLSDNGEKNTFKIYKYKTVDEEGQTGELYVFFNENEVLDMFYK